MMAGKNADGFFPAADHASGIALEISTDVAPAHPGDSIISDGQVVGTITSAAFGHHTRRNLAMGFVDTQYSVIGWQLSIMDLQGWRYRLPCRYVLSLAQGCVIVWS